ncbi:LAFE_0F13124g1_1 [Lachancea fermentati]|uniref:LAFE_0F13124g1_1 n=1 Tax=Lachancea fermentati TaxID=4955 RepID=A0A1G4MFU7_LACFM|nr:LAFE_0F13124g1_1 [Lachancea fermentati]
MIFFNNHFSLKSGLSYSLSTLLRFLSYRKLSTRIIEKVKRKPSKRNMSGGRNQKRRINSDGPSMSEDDPRSSTKRAHGLNMDIHPALRSSNLNLIGHRGNPYLLGEESNSKEPSSYVYKRYARGLKFHEPGEIASRIEEERTKAAKEEQEKEKEAHIRREKVLRGELPDESIGEEKYLYHEIPDMEWWDTSFIKDPDTWTIAEKYSKTYNDDEDDSDDSDDEDDLKNGIERPSIRYIQHPVPYLPNRNESLQTRIYLTKKEQKKIRRNNRKLLREEHEQKIKLGLEEKPTPKVKLSNMMSVYQNNENITDPTSWERTVKKQVEERYQHHIEENTKRHLEAVKRKHEEQATKKEVPSQFCCRVFRFSSLRNPKVRYKLATNSRQLALRGICVHVNGGPGILVVIGTEKACRFYERLVLKRIRWNENFHDKTTNEEVDNSQAQVEMSWEGYLRETKFRGWFMKQCASDEEMRALLREFDAESFLN